MTQTDHFEAGLATLSSDPKSDFPENAPWSVNGVAIPVNTVVNGGQNVDHFYTESVLEDAGGLLEGKPIVKNFHELDGQANADDVIGEVTSAGFQKGVGLVFEGEVTDPDIAQKIKQGYLDVSPTPARSLGEFDESMGAQEVERLADFRDVAIVANGQPGAKVEMGSNPAVEALAFDALARGFDPLQEDLDLTPPQTAQENAQKVLRWREEHPEEINGMTEVGWNRAEQLASGEELSRDVVKKMAQFNRHRSNASVDEEHKGKPWMDAGRVAWLGWGGDTGINWAIRQSEKMDTMSETDTLETHKEVAGVRFRGTKEGKLDKSAIDKDEVDLSEHYLYGSGEDKNDFSYPVVDADGFLRKGNVQSAWEVGCQGQCPSDETHDEKLMELAQEFDTPPEFAQEEEDTNSDEGGESEETDTNTSETVAVVEEVPVKKQRNEVTVIE